MFGKRFFLLFFCLILTPNLAYAKSSEEQYEQRMELYKRTEQVTNIPWYYIAAIDQYERNIRSVRNDLPKATGLSSIYIQREKWAGLTNPNKEDVNEKTIRFFDGMGMDGNGDGKADPLDDEDVLYTFAHYLLQYGTDHKGIKIGLWNYYKRDKTVGIIMGIAKLFKQFQRIDLNEHHFPVSVHVNYSYRDTWGDRRGWGGRRIHEGTDIFAGYGVNVYSTCYGVVEMKGWNKYGGWRIGIRDINNTYHYFAHLNGFAKDLKLGDIVKPGQLIGSVGSSGYGPPGTSGKFPPHLHYGMYKDNGKTEWSFDPYPHLKHWERETKRKK
ncbi:M23 family metallopeptidase [Fervidibacillus albus]|uniref:M23 family metallopeptidase n=1 Tax=Fervidibacillus albus TaxID=2980026 RepID=A0A9E8RWD3_9BACI|nr:M23 family metallopeptidase [Fervidibacillus albus]WAA09948.1 M23 family metallopeptidase [Fervidibacillus albus]